MSDPARLAPRLRPEDAEECLAAGLQPSVLIADSLALSHEAWAAEENGVVIALWGYGAEGIFGEADAWLLTAPEIERHKKLFIRLNLDFLSHVLNLHGSVVGHVHAKYKRAVRWLAWLGFQRAGTLRINGAEFFVMRLRRQ